MHHLATIYVTDRQTDGHNTVE